MSIVRSPRSLIAGSCLFALDRAAQGHTRWLPHAILILVHLASMTFHAFFGVALMLQTGIFAQSWFGAVHPAWRPSLAADQHLAAGIAWGFGEIPAGAVMAILIVQWIRADEREQRRLDRAADRAEAEGGADDDLARYNAFLRAANHGPPQR